MSRVVKLFCRFLIDSLVTLFNLFTKSFIRKLFMVNYHSKNILLYFNGNSSRQLYLVVRLFIIFDSEMKKLFYI